MKALRSILSTAAALAVATFLSAPALAGEPLTLIVTQGSTIKSAGFTSVTDLLDTAQSVSAIQSRLGFDTFDASQNSQVEVDYLGVKWMVDSTVLSGNTQRLRFYIPEIGVDRTYDGTGSSASAARKAAYDALTTDLKKDADSFYARIQQQVAATTPNSVIAGNPSSIQSQTAAANFSAGFSGQVSKVANGPGDARIPNLIGAGFTYGRYKQDGQEVRTATLPLSYSWRFDGDPNQQVTFSLPITAGDVSGAKTYAVQAGLAYRHPVASNWSLTPAVGFGVAGSADLGQAAKLASASLTSAYTIDGVGDHGSLSIGNMIGYYTTLQLEAAGYRFDPGIHNTVYRNGVMYGIPLGDAGAAYSLEFSYINTLFTGTKLYTRSQNELGVTFGTNRLQGTIDHYLRLRVAYVKAKDSNGLRLDFGYWF